MTTQQAKIYTYVCATGFLTGFVGYLVLLVPAM